MSTRLEMLGIAAAAVAAGTIYVLVHEARRKHKKATKMAAEAPISKEMLLKILTKSAEASKSVIERVCITRSRLPHRRRNIRKKSRAPLLPHLPDACVRAPPYSADPCGGAQDPAGEEPVG